MNQSKLPPGWAEARIRRVLDHYENQSEDEAVAEDEAAFNSQMETVMAIPTELVPAVRELIARHQLAHTADPSADGSTRKAKAKAPLVKHDDGAEKRSRNQAGTLREKRGDTHVGTIEAKYGVDVGVRSDMRLDTLKEREGAEMLGDLLKKKQRLPGTRLPSTARSKP
jgi:hypothetical protein